MSMLTRRHVLAALGASAAVFPARLALAAAPGDKRFVLVILRGGMDGLAAVPPYGDPALKDLRRGQLAIAEPGQPDGALDLGGRYGLHPALAPIHEFYKRGEMLVIHAACMTNNSDTFLLQMGEVVRILDLAVRMIRLRGLRPYEDIDIEFTGIRPGEKLTEQLFEDNAEVPTPTVHPNIIRLNGVKQLMDGVDFLQAVERLLAKGFTDRTKALEELLELASLMTPENYPAIAGE